MRLKNIIPVVLLCSFVVLLPCCISHSFPVYILYKPRFETTMSTTLRWISAYENYTDYNDAVIAAYELASDNTTKRPVYICRVRRNKFIIPGYVRPSNKKCIVITSDVELYQMSEYQVLVNVGNIAKLDWIDRPRFGGDFVGSVLGAFDPKTYIARIRLRKPDRLTYVPGYFEPMVGFGRYTFITERNELIHTEHATLLVETVPIGYELRNIKYDDEDGSVPIEEKILAKDVLRNEGSKETKIESKIQYNYTYSVNWGYNHSLSIGLPLDVYEENETEADTYYWGKNRTIFDGGFREVQHILTPGTAVNVTVTMKYVQANIPYTATLVCLYKQGEKREITIKDTLKRSKMKDIVVTYSSVYFFHNNTNVTINPGDGNGICPLIKKNGASPLVFPSIGFVLSIIIIRLGQLQ